VIYYWYKPKDQLKQSSRQINSFTIMKDKKTSGSGIIDLSVACVGVSSIIYAISGFASSTPIALLVSIVCIGYAVIKV